MKGFTSIVSFLRGCRRGVFGNLSLFKKGNGNNGSPTKFLGDDRNHNNRSHTPADHQFLGDDATSISGRAATAGFTLIELLITIMKIVEVSHLGALQYALTHYGLRELTVNEQNPQAMGFYI